MVGFELELLKVKRALERVQEIRESIRIREEGSDAPTIPTSLNFADTEEEIEFLRYCIKDCLKRALRDAMHLVEKAETLSLGAVTTPEIACNEGDQDLDGIIQVLHNISDAWMEMEFMVTRREERVQANWDSPTRKAEVNQILVEVMRRTLPELAAKAIGPGRKLVHAIREMRKEADGPEIT